MFNKKSIFGILNITPDSFSDGGSFLDIEKAVQKAAQMQEEGADVIDIGGESTRPFSSPVSQEDEEKRILPAIEKIKSQVKAEISVDTRNWKTAEKALKSGASIINDVTGFRDEKMIEIAAKYNAKAVIMHMKGEPKTMQDNPSYGDLLGEICSFFEDRIKKLEKAGVKEIAIDPGIGFGKTYEHNLILIKNISFFKKLSKPIMIGVSRKSFIGFYCAEKNPKERLGATIAANVLGFLNGADIFRVHDVKACRQALEITGKIISV
ncbi:MAG: dihydropteroate synthase [Elusimicrobiota bacterium]